MDALSLSPGSALALVPLLRRSLSWVAALAVAFFFSACGGGGGSDPAPPGGPGPSAPTITTQPASQSVTAPAAATFTVVATGSPTYQWQLSTNAGASFSDIAGATSASYATPATVSGDSGKQFRVVVSNSAGNATSSAATLTVTTASATTIAGYPYALTIDSSSTLWVSVLPNIHSASAQFAGLVQSVDTAGGVTTLAGSATQGLVNGSGTAAQFNAPIGIVRDSAGNTYIADANNNVVRKITPAGTVTTFAGSGASSSTDGTGTAASFFTPRGLAVDSGDNIYVAERGGNKIRKITPAGVVTTIAGGSSSGHADGTGAAATFLSPEGIAVDSAGNLYVTDTGNNTVRMITPGAVVTTLAGNPGRSGLVNGTGSAASFTGPSGIAVDSAGTVFVADSANHAIRKITSAGVVTTLAGSGSPGFTNGTGTAATFSTPLGVTVDASGNPFIADSGNHAIRRITSGGVVTTVVN